MFTKAYNTKPVRGMTLAFRATASQELADVPARVVDIWPRFRSGEYLVTLEFEQPVAFKDQLIQQIDAFFSELYQPHVPALLPVEQRRQPRWKRAYSNSHRG